MTFPTKTILSLSLCLFQVRWGQGQDLHLPHLFINKSSALVPAIFRSPQPQQAPNNKSLDPASLRHPAQSKYLKPLYLISPGSLHWKDQQWRVLLRSGGGRSNPFKVHPACYFCCTAGRERLIWESSWLRKKGLPCALPAYPNACVNTG